MITLEEPIARVLKDFCHVEWYEVDELADLIRSGSAKFEVGALRRQFERFVSDPKGIASPVNELTGNEFESDEDARDWMMKIYRKVFSGDQT